MTISFNGTSGVTFPDASTQATAATGFGFKNRIINGAMMIDARNAGASVTPTNGAYTLDRWQALLSQASKYSVQQNAGSVTPPVGFTNYLGVTSLSSYSIGAGDYFTLCQYIEGFNASDFAWGTASAATVTLSFWVRSSLTGTFGGSIQNNGQARSYPFTYTISSANTWTQVSVTIAGDTSGTWLTNNGRGLQVNLGFGMGSTYGGAAGSWSSNNYIGASGTVSVVGTNGATFYITGVQLEKGSTATSFDYRPYGTELVLCQRYAQVYTGVNNTRFALGGNTESTLGFPTMFLPVAMRATPSVSVSAASDFKLVSHTGTGWTATSISFDNGNTTNVTFNVNVGSATSNSVLLAGANSNAKLTLSSEL